MKKTILFVSMLAMTLGFVACSNEDDFVEQSAQTQPQSETMTIFATGEACTSGENSAKATRTQLGKDNKVVWSEGDKLYINSSWYELSSGVGTSTGAFSGKKLDFEPKKGLTGQAKPKDYDAFYGITGYSLPDEQTYVPNKKISNVPMLATVTIGTDGEVSKNVEFKNLCGLLHLTLKKNDKDNSERIVKKIQIYTDKDITGSFAVSDYAAKMDDTGTKKTVTLNCEEGVALNTTGVDFYISLPENVYSAVAIKIIDQNDNECLKTLKYGNVLKITRSKITQASFTAANFDTPINLTGTVDGQDYVDLGTGVLWATKNLGANSQYDTGKYFAWGELKGGNYDNSKNTASGDKTFFAKTSYEYTSIVSSLDADHDAVVADSDWGTGWRMPTRTEMNTLLLFDWEWDNKNEGYKVTGINGKTIFLPVSGLWTNAIASSNNNKYGHYWTKDGIDATYAYALKMDGKNTMLQKQFRYCGLVIRPVHDR